MIVPNLAMVEDRKTGFPPVRLAELEFVDPGADAQVSMPGRLCVASLDGLLIRTHLSKLPCCPTGV